MSQSPPQIYRFTQQFRALAKDISREKAAQMTDRRFKEIHLSEFPKLQEFLQLRLFQWQLFFYGFRKVKMEWFKNKTNNQ